MLAGNQKVEMIDNNFKFLNTFIGRGAFYLLY